MLYIFIFILGLLNPQSFQKELTPISVIAKNANFMTTDHFGNIYLVNNNILWKFNKDGDSLSSYNTKSYGSISFVDATDPYKVLVFHRDYGILQFLDNFLSKNASPIELQELSFDQAELVCHSSENGFWVYDPTRQKIQRIDKNFNPTHQTVNLRQWFGSDFFPNYMLEYNQRLYVNDPKLGILVFDQFATYIKTIPLLGLKSPQLMEKLIYFHNKDQFCNYGLETLEKNCTPLPTKNALDVRIEKNRLHVLKDGILTTYKYN